jgi:hypothetical protein
VSSRYSSSYSEQERSHREINGDDFHRSSERFSEKTTDMRGDPEPQYAQVNKRVKDSHTDSNRRGEDNRSVSSHHSHHSRHDRDSRSLDGDRRRTPRRAMDEVKVSHNLTHDFVVNDDTLDNTTALLRAFIRVIYHSRRIF